MSRLRDRLRSLKTAGVSSTGHQRRVQLVPSKGEAEEILKALLQDEVYVGNPTFKGKYGITTIEVTEPGKASLPAIRLNRDDGCFEYLGNPLMVGTEKATCDKFTLAYADGLSVLLDEDGEPVEFKWFKSRKDRKNQIGFVAKNLKNRSRKGKLSLEFNSGCWVLKISPAAVEEWVLGCDVHGGGHKLTLPKGVARGEPWGLKYVDSIEEDDDNSIPEDMSNPS